MTAKLLSVVQALKMYLVNYALCNHQMAKAKGQPGSSALGMFALQRIQNLKDM